MKLKWILTALLAIVVAVIVAGYVAITQIDPESYRGQIEAEAEKATGRKLTLAGPMDLKVSLSPAITVEDVSFANAAWGSREQMATLKRLEVEVGILPLLSGNIQIKRLVLIEPDILLEVNKQGQTNWTFDTGKKPETAETTESDGGEKGSGGAGGIPEVNAVLIKDGLLVYRDAASGQETKVSLAELSARNAGASSPLDLSIEGSYQDVAFDLAGSVGSLVALSADGDYPVNLDGSFAGADLSLSGTVGSPMSAPAPNLDFSVEGDSLASFNPVAGGGLPPLGPYSLAGKLGGGGNTYKITGLAAKIGDSDLGGDVTLGLGGKRPKIAAQLTSKMLKLADFSAGDEGDGGDAGDGEKAEGKTSKYVFTEDSLPLDGLRAADMDVSVKVATLEVNDKMSLTEIDLPVKLAAGDLALGPAKATLSSGGQVDINLVLAGSKSTPTMQLALNAAEIDYGRLLRQQEISKDVEGKVDADIALTGAGTTPRAIASGMNGKVEIIGGEGVITNKLLAIISAGLSDVMGPLMGDDEDSKLHCVVARFNVKNGLAKSRAILLDTATFTVGGDGEIDLRTEELDLYFDTETRQASIASLAVPFIVGGTLKSPSVSPDPVGTALGAAKAAGTVVNPLLGIGVIVADQVTDSSDENPCVAALEDAPAAATGSSGGSTTTEGTSSGTDKVKDAVEGVEKGIKSLFGD